MSENFESMSVLELRSLAKEMGVKLGAGINKQGIVEKLQAAAAKNAAAAQSAVSSASAAESAPETAAQPRVRSASIITDDDSGWNGDDDVPVLTANAARASKQKASSVPVAAASAATSQTAAPAQQHPSVLSSISSKAPAFTMEGARAWHNPRAFSPSSNYQAQNYQNPSYQNSGYQNPNYQNTGAGYQPRTPVQQRPAYGQTQAPVQQRPTYPQTQTPAAQQRSYPAPQRFGPADQNSYQQDNPQDYRASGGYEQRQSGYQDYRPSYQPRSAGYNSGYNTGYAPRDNAVQQRPTLNDLMSAGECIDGSGILEPQPEGHGFLRSNGLLPGKNDVYVSYAQIRRFHLRSGDYIEGKTRAPRDTDRFSNLLYITKVNDVPVDDVGERPQFDQMTAMYPRKRLVLTPRAAGNILLRQIDTLTPLGFGQRALVASPSAADQNAFLKMLTDTISQRHPSTKQMMLLIDEKPEEATALRDKVKGEVLAANMDETPETQVRVCELALERAMRLVEQKNDVVIIVDDMNRLLNAYDMAAPQNARPLPCGVTGYAFSRVRCFFGAARLTKEGGSLTIIALTRVNGDAVSEMLLRKLRSAANAVWTLADDTENVQLDLASCRTQRDDLQFTDAEEALAEKLRQVLAQKGQPALNQLFEDAIDQEALNVRAGLLLNQE